MDGNFVRLAVAAVLGAHGAGHILGWMPAFGMARFDGVSSRSWALTRVLGVATSQALAGVLFLVPTAGFLIAAAGLATGQSWWRGAAVGSAAASIVCTALFSQAFTSGSTAGSLAVNALVLVGVLAIGWGPATA